MELALRLKKVAPSATLALTQKALELRAQGEDVVSLTAGEPDFSVAPHIASAIAEAAGKETHYTAVAGSPELKEAIIERYRAKGQTFEPAEVMASTGAKQCLFNAMLALVNEGDEVIVGAPYWLSYADMARIAGANVKVIESTEEEDFLLREGQLQQAISDNTKIVVLNSPSNPTGALYDKTSLAALAEVLRKHPKVVVIWDEIYDQITFGSHNFVSLLDVAPDLRDRTLIVNGCSKAYAMTGHRIGWALGPRALIAAMTKIQGQSTSNPSAPFSEGR